MGNGNTEEKHSPDVSTKLGNPRRRVHLDWRDKTTAKRIFESFEWPQNGLRLDSKAMKQKCRSLEFGESRDPHRVDSKARRESGKINDTF